MIFLRDSLCLSAVSLSRQRHDILDFTYCPLSRVLHLTLTNWQRFGFQFHLKSSPSAYGRCHCHCPVKLSTYYQPCIIVYMTWSPVTLTWLLYTDLQLWLRFRRTRKERASSMNDDICNWSFRNSREKKFGISCFGKTVTDIFCQELS